MEKKNKTALIKARITEEQKREIEEYCEKNLVTISSLIRDAINKFLALKK